MHGSGGSVERRVHDWNQVGAYSVRTPNRVHVAAGQYLYYTSPSTSPWATKPIVRLSRELLRLSPSTKHIPSGTFAFRFRGRPLGRPQIDDVRQFGAHDRSPAGEFVAAAVASDGEQPGRECRPLWVERCQGSEHGQEHLLADSLMVGVGRRQVADQCQQRPLVARSTRRRNDSTSAASTRRIASRSSFRAPFPAALNSR